MSVDHYLWKAREIADELLDLLTPTERKAYGKALERDDPYLWADLSPATLRRALAFATETPAKRHAAWQRVPEAERMRLWLLARAQALRAANILAVLRDAGDVQGMKYRDAVRHVAVAVDRSNLLPSPDDLLDPVLE